MIKYQVAGERGFKVQPRGVKYSCEALEVVPGQEGFWESFWRNGLIVAAIQAWQANATKIKKQCDNYVANPNSFENANGDNINAMKILPKPDMLKLIDGLKKLGTLLKSDAKDMSKATREKYINALAGTGIQVQYDKVKGQYKWDCGSLWGALGIGIIANLLTSGLYGFVNSASFGLVNRKVQTMLHKIPAAMDEKGYAGVSDYKQLCKSVSELIAQSMELKTVTIDTSKAPDKSIAVLVKSASEVYQREVKEICYAMVKVINGLSDSAVLSWV
jgi:hypothetical protein